MVLQTGTLFSYLPLIVLHKSTDTLYVLPLTLLSPLTGLPAPPAADPQDQTKSHTAKQDEKDLQTGQIYIGRLDFNTPETLLGPGSLSGTNGHTLHWLICKHKRLR